MSERKFGNHVIQHPYEYSVCTGCASCQTVCGLLHDGCVGPSHGCIRVQFGDLDHMYHTILACQHCEDHPCYNACPKKDKAMRIDENNIVYIVEEECIGCGLCAKACVFKPSRIVVDRKARKAKKCDLCRTREGGPLCVEHCPVRVLGLSEEPLPYEINDKGEVKAK